MPPCTGTYFFFSVGIHPRLVSPQVSLKHSEALDIALLSSIDPIFFFGGQNGGCAALPSPHQHADCRNRCQRYAGRADGWAWHCSAERHSSQNSDLRQTSFPQRPVFPVFHHVLEVLPAIPVIPATPSMLRHGASNRVSCDLSSGALS